MQTHRVRLATLVVLVVASTFASAKDAEISVSSLKSYEAKVEKLVQEVLPCTVCVLSADGQGSGSGVIVSDDGLVLTAAHVMLAAGRDLRVVFLDGSEVKAKPLGAHRTRDVGMVQIIDEGTYPHVEVGKSAPLETNQWCVALGHAGGFDPRRTPPIRLGRVLSNDRFLTTDGALIGGDSGGPLFDLDGRLIGIHSNIGASLSRNNHVPIDAFHEVWDRLVKGETWGQLPGTGGNPNRPVLGFQMSVNPSPRGVGVESVLTGSPADEAGLKAGDIIQQVSGRDVRSAPEVVRVLLRMDVGDEVILKVLRDDESLELSAQLVRARDLSDPSAESPKPIPKKERSSERRPDGKTRKGNPNNGKARPGKKEDGEFDMEELMRRFQENGGRLRLTPKELRQLQEQMGEHMVQPGFEASSEIQEWGQRVFAAYEPVVARARRSTLPVFVRGRQVALGTAVDSAGVLMTKASEIVGRDFRVEVEPNRRVEGKLVRTIDEYDLAIIRVDADLTPVQWAKPDIDWQLGKFVAAVSDEPQPEAIGVISVMPRSLDAAKQGFLGVVPEAAVDGVKLSIVQQGTPAAEAGLQVGDIVLSLAGKVLKTPSAFAKTISQYAPGDRIALKMRRGTEEFDLEVELGDRASLAPMPGRMGIMNRLGGRLSQRRGGFKLAVQHDLPIDPEDCGGPLVDLDGRVIGINIARAGRIRSYAVTAETVQSLLAL